MVKEPRSRACTSPWTCAYARARTNDQIMATLEAERHETIGRLASLFEPELAAMAERERRVALAGVHSATTVERTTSSANTVSTKKNHDPN